MGRKLRPVAPRQPDRAWPVAAEDGAPTAAAVLIPLFEVAEAPKAPATVRVLLTRRTEDVRTHKGQISFPGGARDAADADLEATALRETHEEIGLPPASVRIIGRLPDFHTITGFVVAPFVGVIAHPHVLRPNPREIAEVIEPALDEFVQPGVLRAQTVEYRGIRRAVLFYHLSRPDGAETVVWGATAAMLKQLLDLDPGGG